MLPDTKDSGKGGPAAKAMTAQNIFLNVRGAHVEGNTQSATEFLTEGRLFHDDCRWIIEFEETELTGMRDVTTRVIVDGQQLSLVRTGSIESEFCFQERQMFETAYETPFGLLQIQVLPTQVASRIDPDSGHIDLGYVIRTGEASAFNRLNIHYQLRS